MLLYSQEENGDCVSSEEDHFILSVYYTRTQSTTGIYKEPFKLFFSFTLKQFISINKIKCPWKHCLKNKCFSFFPYRCRFFLEQNNRIFQTLSEVAGRPEPILTQESVRAMGLDPHGDRLFLLHLLETYGYDSLLVTDHPCCSWGLGGTLTDLQDPAHTDSMQTVWSLDWEVRILWQGWDKGL